MTLEELVLEFATIAKDEVTPVMWSDAELTRYANEAEREACRRALILVDRTNVTYTSVAITAGINEYAFDSKIICIDRVKLNSMTYPLVMRTKWQMDECFIDWESTALSGQPHSVVVNSDEFKFKLYPTPAVNDTARLIVRRYPVADMALASDEPEIPDINNWHQTLVRYMLGRAYMVDTQDQQAPQLAAVHMGEFDRVFGPRGNARSDHWIREHRGVDLINGNFA